MSNSISNNWNSRKPIIIGYLALAALVLGLGVWSSLTTISGAIIASGLVKVETHKQVIQHPDGGVVREILVKEGDHVKVGQALIKLDERLIKSELAIVESQLFELQARRGRLVAESEGADKITFDQALLEEANKSTDVAKLLNGQERLFNARIDTMIKETEQLNERKLQVKEQISGSNIQLTSLDRQLELTRAEVKNEHILFKKKLVKASRVLASEREEASLIGQIGALKSSLAEARARIAEVDIELLKLTTARRERALTDLRDLQYRELELAERRQSNKETLNRLDISAPVSGIVYDMKVYAVRSVVRPADPIMYIVPQNTALVISARVPSIHIDEVYLKQNATMRFSAFDQRTTPEIFGYVTKISPDAFIDETTGASYYQIEVLPNKGELSKLKEVEILPGMPVETFIKTKDRTPLNYLTKPLADYFRRAFRES